MFIFLERDAFAGGAKSIASGSQVLSPLGLARERAIHARRPYRGIQIKEDIFATLSVRKSTGEAIPLTSSSASGGSDKGQKVGWVRDYADFILQGITDQRVEKQQIIETFGDPFVYFFGERPRIVNMRGLLINTEDFNWRSQFWENYENHLRGTKLVKENARVYLSYDTMVIEGYPLSAEAVDDSEQPYSIPFSMTMFVTSYYDWSQIGDMRFPQEAGADIDTLNKELDDRRGKYLSSTAAVRSHNIFAKPATGIAATIRKGIRAVNEFLSTSQRFVDAFHATVSGRNVRMPIGVAGFLEATGEPQIAGGSLLEQDIPIFDQQTGQYRGVRGSIKLRMPGPSRFAPGWTSKHIKGSARGYIFENYDEYPALAQNTWNINEESQLRRLEDIISESDAFKVAFYRSAKQVRVTELETELAWWNFIAETGSIVGDIAQGVALAKANFGTIMTAKAFARDPLGTLNASIGDDIKVLKTNLSATGRKLRGAADPEKIKKYISSEAQATFRNTRDAIAESFGPLGPAVASKIGDAYKGANYAPGDDGVDANYERAYAQDGDQRDYTTLTNATGLDATVGAFVTGEESGFEGDQVSGTIDDVYGNRDVVSDVEAAALDRVYGTGASSSSVRSPAEIAAALQQAIGGADIPEEEDTRGIRGIDDVDTTIEPVV